MPSRLSPLNATPDMARRVGGALLLALLIIILLSWLHVGLRNSLQSATRQLGTIRQARVDLTKGFLHLTLAEQGQSAFSSDNGITLLLQGISALEQSAVHLDVGSLNDLPQVQLKAATFLTHLQDWRNHPAGRQHSNIAMRIAFSELEDQADQVDSAASKKLDQIARQNSRTFALALVGSVLALAIIIAIVVSGVYRQQLAQQKQLETDEEMKASNERFQRLFREAPLPLGYVQGDGTVLELNNSFVRLFGYTQSDIPDMMAWWLHAYPDPVYRALAQQTWYAELARTGATGADIKPTEYRVTCKDGSERIMLVSGIAIGADFMATFFDVTERKHAEQAQLTAFEELKQARLALLNQMEDAVLARTSALQAEEEIRRLNMTLEQRVEQRTAELQTANRELDAFAYAVSHDLRAPLRAMSGFSQALEEDFGDQLTGNALVYLRQIRQASLQMSELIDALLQLSRNTRGVLVPEQVDITRLAQLICKELGLQEPERNVACIIEPGLTGWADPRMLQAVLHNLLENAWKYTARNEAAEIRLYHTEGDGMQQFCVADNGAGFDMRYADKLFQPFQRLHRQDEFTGIGIGLTTVQRIIHRHGGRITAQGEPGKGATFCFTLPFLQELL